MLGVVKIGDFLERNEIPVKDFAANLGVTPEAVRLWMGGQRVPRPEVMGRIAKITQGQVGAEDFYPPSSLRSAS